MLAEHGHLRNLAGMVGIGLLCAALLGGALAWAGPAAYLMIALSRCTRSGTDRR
ncbi:hypothetical protein ABZU25_20855 [Micromonospora sp. NPDC005215]|uniref:hypothetical protein n=1 Tax=Micromonospora sp. NPDC005215 TaxID=3157024 RepID=UPI0033A537A0